MNRRTFMTGMTAIVLSVPAVTRAQPSDKPARVGFLTAGSRSSYESGERRAHREAFTSRLRQLGWIERTNFLLESRYADGRYDRLPALAAELVAVPVDVLFANAAPAALAAKQATTSIPVVFETLGDPVAAGLVSTLARPGGNLTGISGLGPDLSGKRLELLKELIPGLRRVILVVNPSNVMSRPTVHETEKAANIFDIRVELVAGDRIEEIERAMSSVRGDGTTAAIVAADPMLLSHARRIQAILLKQRLPATHAETGWLQAGGLMLFGSSLLDHFRQAATLVDKILRGARAGDLPVEQSTKFELIVNRKTAKALHLTIPPSLLARADQVIE
jgi:putative tryptophan/tyrosine transport system substrate-binding protein